LQQVFGPFLIFFQDQKSACIKQEIASIKN
jgi:hypothetical protein